MGASSTDNLSLPEDLVTAVPDPIWDQNGILVNLDAFLNNLSALANQLNQSDATPDPSPFLNPEEHWVVFHGENPMEYWPTDKDNCELCHIPTLGQHILPIPAECRPRHKTIGPLPNQYKFPSGPVIIDVCVCTAHNVSLRQKMSQMTYENQFIAMGWDRADALDGLWNPHST